MIYLTASVVLLLSLLRFLFDTIQVIRYYGRVRKRYLVKLLLYATSTIFVAVYWADCQCIALWQWQFGVIAVLLSWINLFVSITKFPLIGIYFVMLIQVFYTFLKVVLLSFLLVVAFALSFYMAFHEPSIVVRCNFKQLAS